MTMKSTEAPSLMKIELQLNSKPVEFFLDTGAEANVIDEDTFASMGRPCTRQTGVKGKMFDGTTVALPGKGNGTFVFGDQQVQHDFYVASKVR